MLHLQRPPGRYAGLKTDKAANLLREALKQMNDGKYSRSFALLKELLAADPSHTEARRLLATLLLKFGNLGTARTAFETLVKEAFQRREYAEAQSLLREYLSVAPRCVAFLDLLGQAHELGGDPLGAVFEYEKAIDLLLQDPDPERPTYAQELFEKIKLLAPSSFVANRVAARMPAASPSPPAPETIGPDDRRQAKDEQKPEMTEPVSLLVPPLSDESPQDTLESETEVGTPADHDDGPTDERLEEDEIDDDIEKPVPFPPVNAMGPSSLGADEMADLDEDVTHDEHDAPSSSEDDRSDAGTPAEASEPQPVTSYAPADVAETSAKQTLYWERVTGAVPSPHVAVSDSTKDAPIAWRRHSGPGFFYKIHRRLAVQFSVLRRRVVWLTGSFTRLSIALGVAIVVWIVLIVGLAAGTWLHLEEKPSETFQSLMNGVPPKSIDDPNNNGYLLLLGFSSDEAHDPLRMGYERWLTRGEQTDRCFTQEPTGRLTIAGAREDAPTARWFKELDPAAEFAEDTARVRHAVDSDGSRLTRYQQWLTLPFEDWGFGYTGGVGCREILDVHRLYLVEGFAQGLTPGLERVESDLLAWRKVAAQSKTLAMKVLALTALNDDAAVMSGLLHRSGADNKVIQRVTRMAKPFNAEERSLKWPVQNEFVLAAKRMDGRLHRRSGQESIVAAAVLRMPLPKQRTLNAYAAYHERVAHTPWTANGKMPSLYEFAHVPARTWIDYVLNPIDNILSPDTLFDWHMIAGMVLEADARMRLAGLQARLRAASGGSNPVARIAQAGPPFFDPFTDLPMLVDPASHRLYSVGIDGKDDHGDPAFDVSVPYSSLTP